MSRKFLTIFVVVVTSLVGAMWYRWAIQTGSIDATPESGSAMVEELPLSNASVAAMANPAPHAASMAGAPKPLDMEPAWESAVASQDPAARAAALAGLVMAPRVRALLILQNLLKDGAYPDRQLVINSLTMLARQQGDADERIRTALRIEIYDGSDESISTAAQVALAELEQDFS